jgi:hypothetical protein
MIFIYLWLSALRRGSHDADLPDRRNHPIAMTIARSDGFIWRRLDCYILSCDLAVRTSDALYCASKLDHRSDKDKLVQQRIRATRVGRSSNEQNSRFNQP